MKTITYETQRSLQSLQAIYNRALTPPRYNDHTKPSASLTGLWVLHNNSKNTVVDRKTIITKRGK